MSRTERNLVYIIVGMLLCFIAIFIIIAYIPSGAFDWLFKDEKSSSSSSSQGEGSGRRESEPARNRL